MGVTSVCIVEQNSTTWAMLYVDDVSWNVEYATAPKSDPHNWTKQAGDNPIIVEAGFDIRGVSAFKEGNTFRVYYDDGSVSGVINYAYGTSLASLTKYAGNPVLSGDGVGWEVYVRHPWVIKVGVTYHMFYDGRNTAPAGWDGGIGHATSTDRVTWVRDSANNPLLSPQGAGWESSDVGAPSVAFINNRFYMAYDGYDGTGAPWPHMIGLAVSDDLSTWTRDSDNPVIGYAGRTWNAIMTSTPSLTLYDDDLYIYFHGRDLSLVSDIGYATASLLAGPPITMTGSFGGGVIVSNVSQGGDNATP